MPQRRRYFLVCLTAAALLPLAAATPCAARGTGGFLRDWAVCGPLEGTQLDAPKLPDDFAAYPGLFAVGRIWLPAKAEDGGQLDLLALYPSSNTGTALAHTFFEIPADGTYHIRIGSDDAVRVEIDGRVVHRHDVHRAWEADQDNIRIDLARGWHRMLVRVINYGGEWAASVRIADSKDQPLDVRHQAAAPEPLQALCRLEETLTLAERVAAAVFLTDQIGKLQAELQAATQRLSEIPEGYVTFAEYEGARAQGLKFFRAMADFWEEAARDDWDETAVREAQKAAVEAARGFSEVLAQETARTCAAMSRGHKVWETLGGEAPTRREVAAAVIQIAQLLAQSRRLAARVDTERVLAARFENDIRNWRQRDFTIRVLDAEGGPVDDADVEIVQTGHDFLFGCNLFAFRRWDDERRNTTYEKRFRDLFNLAVVPLYWSVRERDRGRPDFGQVETAVRWCRQNHIQVRGHPLFWSETVPRWVEELKADEARDAALGYVRQTIERFRDTVDSWDVIQQPGPAMRIGPATVEPAQVVRWAIDAKPRGQLLLSGGQPEAVTDAARRSRAGGARVEGVGVAAYQHEGIWTLDMVRRTLDAAAAADLPVHVSEVAILGGPEAEAEQAEAVRHFYTAAFAHPKVASITWWDLSDRFAWRNVPAGLTRPDLSPKPAYRVLDRLINHLWRTDAAGRTGDDGRVTVRAFFGQYKITVHQGRRKAVFELHLGRDGPSDFEVIMPAAK